MFKIKSILIFLLVLCGLLIGCVVNPQQTSSGENRSEKVAIAQSKPDLVRSVLSETGMSTRYDLYLGNSVDVVVSPETAKRDKFLAWMRSLFVQEAGWKYIEAQYMAQLESKFSQAELQELLELAKQPLIKKLLQAEIDAYSDSGAERRRLLFKLWDNYNSGKFNPPAEVLK